MCDSGGMLEHLREPSSLVRANFLSGFFLLAPLRRNINWRAIKSSIRNRILLPPQIIIYTRSAYYYQPKAKRHILGISNEQTNDKLVVVTATRRIIPFVRVYARIAPSLIGSPGAYSVRSVLIDP